MILKGRKDEEKGRDTGKWDKEERYYPYFVSIFNIGPYDRLKKQGKNLKNVKWGEYISRWP